MKKDVILKRLREICDKSGLEDLDLEIFPETIPDCDAEIGEFFIHGDELYVGQRCGHPDYCTIGKTDTLKEILCRTYDEDGMIDFVFEFPLYKIVVSHEEYLQSKISVFDVNKNAWSLKNQTLENALTIDKCIENILKSEYSIDERVERHIAEELEMFDFLDIQENEYEWKVLTCLAKYHLKSSLVRKRFCITCLLNGTLEENAELLMPLFGNLDEIFDVIDALWEDYVDGLGDDFMYYKVKLIDTWLSYHEKEERMFRQYIIEGSERGTSLKEA